MEGNYPVTFCGTVAGNVAVRQQGLYYMFDCQCRISGDVICRLQILCNGVRENLGILVPEHGAFVLRTRLPVKKIGAGEMTFVLVPKHDRGEGKFAPIYPEEPFAYIAQLKGAYLAIKNGQPGIYI